jgi:hypothetical protein
MWKFTVFHSISIVRGISVIVPCYTFSSNTAN